MAGRALAWVGGLALVLGAIFFLSLAFSRGWIGPELRVLLGLAAGSLALAGGAAFMERDNRLLGHVLTPVGLAVISISLVGATSLYHLIPVELGLLIALLSASVAALIAVRADSQIVAGFGLVAVLAAPPLLGAPADLTTLLFVAIVLVGTTSISLWRSWSWLPPVAFVLSAPQAASWINGDPATALGLVGITGYWLLNVIAAGGEAFRRRRNDLSASSATLLLANVAFLVWAGFSLLSGDLEVYRGLFLLIVALAHVAIGGVFVARDGERNLFGLLAIGTGIAALTIAVPIQLGAPAVPVAWTAEAVALAWLAARRGHPYSALVSAILYALAGAALVRLFGTSTPSDLPLVDGNGAALGFFAVGIGLGVWLVRDRSLRSALTAFGLAIAAVCTGDVLDAPQQVMALTVLAVAGMAVIRVLPRLPSMPIDWQVDGLLPRALRQVGEWRPPTEMLLPLAIASLGAIATTDLVVRVYDLAHPPVSAVTFVDPPGLALAAYLLGLVALAWLSAESRIRAPLAALGLLVTAWACAAVLDDLVLVAAWSGLMLTGFLIAEGLDALPRRPPIAIASFLGVSWTTDHALPIAAGLVGSLALVHIVRFELPLEDLGTSALPAIPFTDVGAQAAAVLIACVLASGFVIRGATARRVSILTAGSIAAYAVPFEVAPWAVSVLWVALGGLALLIARTDPPARFAYRAAAATMVGWRGRRRDRDRGAAVAARRRDGRGRPRHGPPDGRGLRGGRGRVRHAGAHRPRGAVGPMVVAARRRHVRVRPVCRCRGDRRHPDRWLGFDRRAPDAGAGGAERDLGRDRRRGVRRRPAPPHR